MGGIFGGGNKTNPTKRTYRPAGYIESGAQQAASMASQYASQKYTPYERERIAPLSANEQTGVNQAAGQVGKYDQDLNAARTSIGGVQQFTDADMNAYMNPYIKSALDPAARELRQQGLRRNEALAAQESSVGAFSGSRSILSRRESNELTDQSVGDLYATGYKQAFDTGAALWGQDQDRALKKANDYMRLAGTTAQIDTQTISNLMDTGETARYVDQMRNDFDYQQFIEERDWTGKQAGYLTDVLRGLKGSYTETNFEGPQKKKGGVFGAVLGIAGSIIGGIYGGPAGAQIGGALGTGVGSVIDGPPTYEQDKGG